MTSQPQEINKMTPGEYLALERNALDIKYEFFDGEAFAMVGAGRNHNRINVNLTRELSYDFKTDQFACDLFSNDMRVKIEDSYAYPNIVIFCGDAAFEDNEFDTLINPIVIMEILSDSTEAFDRGDKFEYYKAIPTLQEYILVSQKKIWVGQFIRKDGGKWEYGSGGRLCRLNLKTGEIKVLLDDHRDRPEVESRFIEEAQIGGQLQHPIGDAVLARIESALADHDDLTRRRAAAGQDGYWKIRHDVAREAHRVGPEAIALEEVVGGHG